MEKINIVELLRSCPTGMELDCVLFDGVVFDEIDDDEECNCPIVIKTKEGETWNLTSTGCWDDSPSAKCVIFPKGKTTWEGFQIPFKDGDVVATNNGAWIGITTGGEKGGLMPVYCVIQSDYTFEAYLGTKNKWYFDRLATEEEKERLFKAIKANGYCWNAETKTLETLIETKFKIGDKVRCKNNHNVVFTITSIRKDTYVCDSAIAFWFMDQDKFELVPNKFNLSTLKPFDSRVLVRDYDSEPWKVSFWGCLVDNVRGYKYDTARGPYKQCIPYEGNEHLLGKTDDCIDFYKTWEC